MFLFAKTRKLSHWPGRNVIYAKWRKGTKRTRLEIFGNQTSHTNQEDEKIFNKEKPQTKQGIVPNTAQRSEWTSNPRKANVSRNTKVSRSHSSRGNVSRGWNPESNILAFNNLTHNKEAKDKLERIGHTGQSSAKTSKLKPIGIFANVKLTTWAKNEMSHLPN